MKKQEDLIEKYIQNRLSPEEVLMVEKLLKNDSDFEQELSLQANLTKAIIKEDDDNFRNLITELELKAKTENTISRRSYVKWLVAASILVLLGLSYFLTLYKNTDNQMALCRALVKQYEGSLALAEHRIASKLRNQLRYK